MCIFHDKNNVEENRLVDRRKLFNLRLFDDFSHDLIHVMNIWHKYRGDTFLSGDGHQMKL